MIIYKIATHKGCINIRNIARVGIKCAHKNLPNVLHLTSKVDVFVKLEITMTIDFNKTYAQDNGFQLIFKYDL